MLAVGSPRAYDDDDDVPLVARVDAGATRDRAHATVAADAHPDATIVPGLEAEPSTALARQRRGCVCHCPARDRPTLPRHEDGSPNPATPFRSNAAISLAGEQSSWNSAQEIKKKTGTCRAPTRAPPLGLGGNYFPPFHKYWGIHFLIYKPSKRPRLESNVFHPPSVCPLARASSRDGEVVSRGLRASACAPVGVATRRRARF